MNLYDPNGYANIRGILDTGIPFIFITGARGVGKTYGALDTCVDMGLRFMFMRRTQAQADLSCNPDFSVFKPLNADKGWDIVPDRISKYNSAFIRRDNGHNEIVGYSCALSTVSNMRGFDASDIDVLIYDEFIPEKHERPIKNEPQALLNAYETMNRNRELKGKPPIKFLGLANSNDISNPYFEYLGLIRIADKMQRKGNDIYRDDKRGLMLIMMHRSPISKKKANTALYRLTQGTDFNNMALDNEFTICRQYIKSLPLVEFTPRCKIGELCIYRHKSNNILYATTHSSGVFPSVYTTSETDIEHFRNTFSSYYDSYIEGRFRFEDVLSEELFKKYMYV